MKKLALLLAFFTIGLQVLLAQTKEISGTVTSDKDGTTIPGVSVAVKGTTLGTITNLDGYYKMSVPADAETLVFSFVGMQTQDVAIVGTTINVALKADFIGLEEVVVVGYGTQTAEAKTGSVVTVGEEELKDVPEVSVDRMLQGKVAGVMITSTNGQPNSDTQIRIRGTSSLNAGNQPLFVVDGIPVMQGDQSYFTSTSNALSTLNPNDIASITILKDAAAASIYGSRAANGVILVTTKTGVKGESKVNVKASYGYEQLANDNDYGPLSAEDLVDFMRVAAVNGGYNPDAPLLEDGKTSNPYYTPLSLLDKPLNNWMDEALRKGKITNIEMSVSGGTEKTRHFVSGQVSYNEGIFDAVEFEKYVVRSNLDHQINDKLSMGIKINLGYTYLEDVWTQGLYYANPIYAGMSIPPWEPIFNEDGSYNLNIPLNANTNPFANAAFDEKWEKQKRLIGNLYFEYKPIDRLTLRTTNSIEYTDTEGRQFWSPKSSSDEEDDELFGATQEYRQMTTSNTATYADVIGDIHSFDVIVGQEATKYFHNRYILDAPTFNPDIPYFSTSTVADDEIDYGETEWSMMSFFGRVNYNYDGKYYLQASLRTDGSSRFGSENRWGLFYSVGASWNAHNESFLQDIDELNILKLRLSYGVNGNDRIGNYDQFGTYSSAQYNGVGGMEPARLANPKLTWELNTAYNVGLDFGLFDRVSGSIDVYKRITSDMLLDRRLSYTTGFGSITQNIGELENRGIEALVNVNIIKSKDLIWDFGVNIAANKSEILDLAENEEISNVDNGRLVHAVGERLYTFKLRDYVGVNPVNGEALFRNADGEITNSYTEGNYIYAGSPEPKMIGGFNTSVSYKGIELSAFAEFKTGNKVLMGEDYYLNADGADAAWGGNQANWVLDYWKEPGDVALNPIPIAGNSSSAMGTWSTRRLQNGDYLRIKNVTLSYTLPSRITDMAKIDRIRIYGSAINLYTFHNVRHFDPERGEDGTGYGIYPQTKKFVIGIDLMF